MLSDTQCLLNQGLGTSFRFALFGHGFQGEGIHRLGDSQVAAVIAISPVKGAVRLLSHVAQAGVEHACCHSLEVAQHNVVQIEFFLAGNSGVLEHDGYLTVLLFFILINNDDGILVVGNFLVNHLGCIGTGGGNILEELLDLCLDVINVNITHDYQGLVVGTIPLVVVVTQLIILEVVNDIHQADGQTLAILRVGEQCLELALQHTHLGTLSQSPLLMDDTALLVDLLVGEQQAAAPVLEDEQT